MFINLAKEFEKRKPWVTQFTIKGKQYGGQMDFSTDPRIGQFYSCFPDVKSILDIGSLEGGQTFELAKHNGVHVTAIEGRDYNVEKAQFVQKLLKIGNVKFITGNLEQFDLKSLGSFDAIFCSGLLYHLPDPWKLVDNMSKVSPRLFIWTHYSEEKGATENVNGFCGHWYNEGGFKDPLSGLSQQSYWLTQQSLMEMLSKYGYINASVIEVLPEHPHGPSITLAAWK
jgi:SAM-dependent methyltransferase